MMAQKSPPRSPRSPPRSPNKNPKAEEYSIAGICSSVLGTISVLFVAIAILRQIAIANTNTNTKKPERYQISEAYAHHVFNHSPKVDTETNYKVLSPLPVFHKPVAQLGHHVPNLFVLSASFSKDAWQFAKYIKDNKTDLPEGAAKAACLNYEDTLVSVGEELDLFLNKSQNCVSMFIMGPHFTWSTWDGKVEADDQFNFLTDAKYQCLDAKQTLPIVFRHLDQFDEWEKECYSYFDLEGVNVNLHDTPRTIRTWLALMNRNSGDYRRSAVRKALEEMEDNLERILGGLKVSEDKLFTGRDSKKGRNFLDILVHNYALSNRKFKGY